MAATEVQRAEGKTAWLAIGLVAAVFAAPPLWIRFGGTAPGPLPPTPANPVAVLEGGEKIAFASGDLVAGDGLLCESRGLRVGGWVPKPGHTTRSRVVAADSSWTASIRIRSRADGAVIVRCS